MLNVGTKFGPYEITGAIGAGGMGEVYRSRDAKLGPERRKGPARRPRLPSADVRDRLDEWTKSVSELATCVRYSPPAAGAKPIEPWFENLPEDTDNDGRPETIN